MFDNLDPSGLNFAPASSLPDNGALSGSMAGFPSFSSPSNALSPFQIAGGVLDGLKTIGGLWNAFQANQLAKSQFNFTKTFANANLANQIKSYNTALYDRARSRAVMENQTPAEMQNYIDQNSLPAAKLGS